MKRKPLTHAARLLCALALSMSLAPAAFAADPSEPTQPSPCYPTAVTRSEDGTEIRKMYDLGPEDDPGGIPRSDFEQDGYHYTLTDLLKQELPANESRQHTETVSVNSKSKDMGAVLALLPQTKEFITEDGLSGVLTLKLDTVKVEAAGYGSSTKTVTATRTYPGLADQDTQYIPKTIQDGGNSMTPPGCGLADRGGRSLYRYGLLLRLRHQLLCEGLYRHRRLRGHRESHQSEQNPLCGDFRGHGPGPRPR